MVTEKAPYKTYQWQRYLFFWLTIGAYFIPTIIATAALLPFVEAEEGTKWGMGIAVVLLNALPFIGGMFRKLLSHVLFVNWLSIVFLVLAAFFTMDLFSDYVATFCTIETVSFVFSIVACVLWYIHGVYRHRAVTVATVVKSGVLKTAKPENKVIKGEEEKNDQG